MQCLPAFCPWLVFSDEVNQFDIILEMPVRWLVLIACARCAVVYEAQPMPRLVHVVLIQKTLVGAVEADACSRHCFECTVFFFIRVQKHETRVETIRPTNIRSSSKRRREIEELINCAKSYDVSIDVDDLAELCLVP